ncbi:MAG TPA: ABC transporter permease [Deltaproteobacteria bacterium]|nr:ABC transporter permease [Candidatus Binatota bacterium]HIL13597.1 ABC transporter permease [Deltaproteobacteria bacterium]
MLRGTSLARLARFSDCLWLLAARALSVRYRRSVLGFAWTLFYPLGTMVILSLVFSQVFAGVDHYAFYVITGVLPWGFFSLACIQAADSLLAASPVLRKVYVPTVVFPASVVAANFVNLLLSLLVLPLVALATGAQALPSFWLLALALGCLLAFTGGVSLLLAAVNLFFQDVRYFFEGILLLWFYATPIVYPVSVLPEHLSWLPAINPFAWILLLMRGALYGSVVPAGAPLLCVAFSFSVLAIGWLLFHRLERRFYAWL